MRKNVVLRIVKIDKIIASYCLELNCRTLTIQSRATRRHKTGALAQ
jgi:hypothetical protein